MKSMPRSLKEAALHPPPETLKGAFKYQVKHETWKLFQRGAPPLDAAARWGGHQWTMAPLPNEKEVICCQWGIGFK